MDCGPLVTEATLPAAEADVPVMSRTDAEFKRAESW
jgi:hypothetical protein